MKLTIRFDMKIFTYTPLLWLCTGLIVAVTCLQSCKEEYDHTVDVANPTVVSYNPVPGVEGVAVSSSLVLTFDEHVKKGSGNIILSSTSDTQTIDVTSAAVVVGSDARVVSISPAELQADEEYTVVLERGTFTDLVGNEYMGTIGDTPWTFVTAGDIGPLVISRVPQNAGTDGSLFKLELNFIDNVSKGEGNIAVYAADNNTKIAELPVSSSAITVTNSRVSITLGSPLAFATAYYVTIDNGAFIDGNGKKFNGFTGNTDWHFTTTSGSGGDLVVHLPLDDDLTDASGNKFDAELGSTATAMVAFVTDPIRGRVANFVAGSYAVLPKHDLLRPSSTQDFSFSLWVKLPGIGSDPALFSNSDWGSGGNPGFVLCTDGALTYAGPGTDGRGWIVKLAGGGNRMDWRAGQMTPQAPALADNQWHLVTVVVNRTTKRLHVYIDGNEYTQEENPASYDLNMLAGALWDETNDYPFTIWEDGTGSYNAGSNTRKELAGWVDDVRIYSKALSAAEVSALYNH
ncbi:Ig-like domain-containing protein [Parapedobacter deserti]|uniref:Ig-like domain-containing protein n=1 Tax=Parapedobacter deserti TaxID=1912957 RepID=A0ABV7JKW6_9SPHI